MGYKSRLTRQWKTTLIVAITLIMFLVTWLLVGEMDLLNVDWIVGHNCTLWKGKVTDENVDYLWTTYSSYIGGTPTEFRDWIGKNVLIINTGPLIFNPYILIPMFGIVIFAIVFPIVLKWIHFSNYDVLPFNIALSWSLFIFMISCLIPSFGSYDAFKWIIRVVIIITCLFIFFITSNRIVNYFLANSVDSATLVNDINIQDKDNATYRKSLDDLVKEYKKRDNIDHVDIEK